MTYPEVFDRLAVMAIPSEPRWTLDDLQLLVTGLIQVNPVDEIAAQLEATSGEIVDLAAQLGTWLSHCYRKELREMGDPNLVTDGDGQGSLFQEAGGPSLLIPAGFEKSATQKRDVRKSLAAVIKSQPDTADLIRFLDLLHPSIAMSTADVETLFTMRRFDQLGRLDEIDKVSADPGFAQTVLLSWTFFRDAVVRCLTALEIVVSRETEPEQVRDKLVHIRWAYEARVDRIERALALGDSQASRKALRIAQTELADEIAARSRTAARMGRDSPYLAELADLSDGQLMRLCEQGGLVSEVSHRRATEIRARLVERGLSAEAEKLSQIAIRAATAGVEDAFWAAIDAKVEGDPLWRETLDEAFAEVSV